MKFNYYTYWTPSTLIISTNLGKNRDKTTFNKIIFNHDIKRNIWKAYIIIYADKQHICIQFKNRYINRVMQESEYLYHIIKVHNTQSLKRIMYTFVSYFDRILNIFAFFYQIYFITFTEKKNFICTLRAYCLSGYRHGDQYYTFFY